LQTSVQGEKVTVKFTLKNTGKVAGDEVAQLYIRDDYSSVVTAVEQLKKFQRVHLAAGEAKEITFELKPEDLKLLNLQNKWVVEPGAFSVMVGGSSDDVKLKGSFNIAKEIFVKD
jgi:beta-glucosidase